MHFRFRLKMLDIAILKATHWPFAETAFAVLGRAEHLLETRPETGKLRFFAVLDRVGNLPLGGAYSIREIVMTQRFLLNLRG
jgi:hypothetical protein